MLVKIHIRAFLFLKFFTSYVLLFSELLNGLLGDSFRTNTIITPIIVVVPIVPATAGCPAVARYTTAANIIKASIEMAKDVSISNYI